MNANIPEVYRTRGAEIAVFSTEMDWSILKGPGFAWRPLLAMDLSRRDYYRENQDFFEETSRSYGRLIKESHMAPVYIRRINDRVGYGVFAGSKLDKGAFIGEYTGVIQEAEEKAGHELDEGGFESDYSGIIWKRSSRPPPLKSTAGSREMSSAM